MYEERGASAVGLTRVVPQETALTGAMQCYSNEIWRILTELYAFLPRYRNSVNPARYAYDQDELMALTVAYCGGASDLTEWEALLTDVKSHRQRFADALGS